ncbi:MAG: hypothetical protein IJP25_04510 [Elusimicrobiaceae bacterium]|nr:hypothetical protein [Elusimicrobiaceae bacterium]
MAENLSAIFLPSSFIVFTFFVIKIFSFPTRKYKKELFGKKGRFLGPKIAREK